MKKVAYITVDPGVPVFGFKGCSVHVQEVVRSFRNMGSHVTLFTQREGKAARPDDLSDVQVHTLAQLSKESVEAREWSALSANDELRAYLEYHGPFDMIYERYSLWGRAGMDYAQDHGIPGILEVNAPLIEEQRKHRTLILETQAREVARKAFEQATTLIAVSRAVANYLASFPGVAHKVHIIPNGVNPGRFTPAIPPSLSAPAGVFTVGFVGTLKPWHGVVDLVEAFSLLQARTQEKSRLLIVGDGPERSVIEERLRLRGLERAAVFTGAVSPQDIPGFLTSMDVGVAPYPSQEDCYFSPLKVFEYMAAGLPVVASRIGQIDELIDHGVNGLLTPPSNASALAEALDRLRLDSPWRHRMGAAARSSVLREHSWESVAGRVMLLTTESRSSQLLENMT